MRLAVIGGGGMGEAVISAVLRAGVCTADSIKVAERYESRQVYLKDSYSVSVTSEPSDALAGADFVLLAVKPQEFEKAAAQLKGGLGAAVAVSIMAGVPIETLVRLTGTAAVVRSMPNTPAMVGEGMTAWTATPDVTDAARDGVRQIFASMGQEAYVPEERYLDMVTALSGSGPAYVFLFIEALTDAGVNVGLTREMAGQMALQTVLGSALYARESGKAMSELRGQVTSPAGTTAAALRVLESGGFRSTILEGVIAAYERSKALGEQGKK